MKGPHIILTGLMGTGKTSVGEQLCLQSGRPFLDTDRIIEEKEGCVISEIFREKGEKYFRDLETETLRDLISEKTPSVISVGGGLPEREENRLLMKTLGTVIWLDASDETIQKRLRGDTARPLLASGPLRQRIESLRTRRAHLYRDASEYQIQTDLCSPQQIARKILHDLS